MSPTPTPPPGLVTEYLETGRWLFRWRSYPPLLVLAYVLGTVAWTPVPTGGAAWLPLWITAGLASGALGLAVRAATVGFVPMGTSGRGTRDLRAETLNTRGLYSVVRHPLYLGAYLLWMGVALLAGRAHVLLVVTLAFWVYYERIMMVEERFLMERHGGAFGEWAARTPAFLPRLRAWSPPTHTFSLRYCLGRDYPALYGFVLSATAVALARSVGSGEGWRVDGAWLGLSGAATAVYAILHLLKTRTRRLEAPRR